MVIKSLIIENFKGISEPVKIEFKPITLLFGQNSVGKSTIIQAMLYLQEVLTRNNTDADQVAYADQTLNLGGFKNLVHGRDLERRIRFNIEINLDDQSFHTSSYLDYEFPDGWVDPYNFVTEFHDINSANIHLEIGWSYSHSNPRVFSYAIDLNGKMAAKIDCSSEGDKPRISYIDMTHPVLLAADDFGIEEADEGQSVFGFFYDRVLKKSLIGSPDDLYLYLSQKTALPKLGEIFRIDDDYFEDLDPGNFEPIELENMRWRIQNSFNHILSLILNVPGEVAVAALQAGRYLGPIRTIPERSQSNVLSENPARWTSGSAAWDVLSKASDGFIRKVNEWLDGKEKLHTGYSLLRYRYKKLEIDSQLYRSLTSGDYLSEDDVSKRIEQLPEDHKLSLVDNKRGIQVAPQDIGVGISQVLPVLVGVLDSEIETFMIEQPELHVHPSLQCRIGDLLISQIVNNSNKVFIIETHSEHLLLRLLRRIRETNEGVLPAGISGLEPNQLSVNYVELTEHRLNVRQLLVSEDGDSLGKWPEGFFEERAGEMF